MLCKSKNLSNNNQVIIVACSYRLTPEELLLRINKITKKISIEHGYIVSTRAKREGSLEKKWSLISTDNLNFDFSAYISGISKIIESHPAANIIIFLNDTLFTNHCAYVNFRALSRHINLMQEIEVPAIAGKTDKYSSICLRNPWNGHDRYVSTYCFMVNRSALDFIIQLPFLADNDGVTGNCNVDDDNWGGGLRPAFRQFLKANLVYKGSPYLWYRLKDTFFSPSELSAKARTIYFEHRLSGSIGELGCIISTNSGSFWSSWLNLCEMSARLFRALK